MLCVPRLIGSLDGWAHYDNLLRFPDVPGFHAPNGFAQPSRLAIALRLKFMAIVYKLETRPQPLGQQSDAKRLGIVAMPCVGFSIDPRNAQDQFCTFERCQYPKSGNVNAHPFDAKARRVIFHAGQLVAMQSDHCHLMAGLHQGDGRLQNPVVPSEVIQYDVGYFHQRAFNLASKAARPRRTCAQ